MKLLKLILTGSAALALSTAALAGNPNRIEPIMDVVKFYNSHHNGIDASLGSLARGGIVVDVESDARLIMTKEDVSSSAVWSTNANTLIQGAFSPNGLANNYAIIHQNGFTDGAALACINLVEGGYRDWYLPSSEQLQKIAEQANAIHDGYEAFLNACAPNAYCTTDYAEVPFRVSGDYWSSTQVNGDADNAYRVEYPVTGTPIGTPKNTSLKVRCVRNA